MIGLATHEIPPSDEQVIASPLLAEALIGFTVTCSHVGRSLILSLQIKGSFPPP